jgi:hypothetical protein
MKTGTIHKYFLRPASEGGRFGFIKPDNGDPELYFKPDRHYALELLDGIYRFSSTRVPSERLKRRTRVFYEERRCDRGSGFEVDKFAPLPANTTPEQIATTLQKS